jgi:hypothetical protein
MRSGLGLYLRSVDLRTMTLEKKSETENLSLSASGTALLTSAIGQQLPIPSPQFAFEAANQIVVGEAGCDACVLNGDAWGEETCTLFIALHDMPRVGINSDADCTRGAWSH